MSTLQEEETSNDIPVQEASENPADASSDSGKRARDDDSDDEDLEGETKLPKTKTRRTRDLTSIKIVLQIDAAAYLFVARKAASINTICSQVARQWGLKTVRLIDTHYDAQLCLTDHVGELLEDGARLLVKHEPK